MGHITLSDLNDPIVSGVEPDNPAVGQLWLDTSTEPDSLRRWDGTEWVAASVTAEEIANIYVSIERNRSSITQTDSAIRLLVEQTAMELHDSLSGLESSLNSAITQTSQDITFAFNEATSYTIAATGEVREYINKIQSYQRFDADG